MCQNNLVTSKVPPGQGKRISVFKQRFLEFFCWVLHISKSSCYLTTAWHLHQKKKLNRQMQLLYR